MKYLFILLALFAVAPWNDAGAQLIQNGSFQTGSFADWTVNEAPSSNLYVSTQSVAPDGLYPGTTASAWFGTPGSVFDYISQTFTSIPGTTYQLSFALETYGNPNEFLANIGGTLNLNSPSGTTSGGLAYYISGGTTDDIYDSSTDAWSIMTLNYTATTSSTGVVFGGVNSNTSGEDYLTEIAVTALSIPEPTSFYLGLLALGFLACYKWQQAKNLKPARSKADECRPGATSHSETHRSAAERRR